MEQWQGKVALVTGASGGIGSNICIHLCQLGMNVVGCDIDTTRIEELSEDINKANSIHEKSVKLIAIKCDVTKEEEVKAVYRKAKAEFGGVDVCVNNAGIGYDAPLLSGSTSDWKKMLDVNILGMCIFTREFIAQLRERSVNSGHIILMNSMSGHRMCKLTSPNLYFYGITKHAVTGLTEGIRRELRTMKSDVKVTAISPGDVRTEFHTKLHKVDDLGEVFASNYGCKAEDVTSSVVYALSTPPRMQVHDILFRSTPQED